MGLVGLWTVRKVANAAHADSWHHVDTIDTGDGSPLANWATHAANDNNNTKVAWELSLSGASALSLQLQVIHAPTWYMIRFSILILNLVPQT
jgi:hypothetical protein